MSKKIEDEVFSYWKKVMGKNKGSIFNAKRRNAVKARIKEGYDLEMFQNAINGNAKSTWHQGDNPQGKKYNDLALICRDGEKLEGFAQIITDVVTVESTQKFRPSIEDVNDISWGDDPLPLEEGYILPSDNSVVGGNELIVEDDKDG